MKPPKAKRAPPELGPPEGQPRLSRKSGVVVPAQARWHGRLAARLIWFFVTVLAGTIRWRFEDRAGLFPPGADQPAIFATWHNRLALALIIHRDFVRRSTTHRRMAALVSASRDGGLLARVLELFQVIPVRGSSSRRGGPALRELLNAAQLRHDLGLTPDGPKGPCYVVQPGVIAVAQLTGYPIVPVSFWLGWKKTLASWDRFQIPLPFTRCHVTFGEVIWVPSDASEADRERLRLELNRRLMELTKD